MSIIVKYPVEIRKYQASIQRGRAQIKLEGVEGSGKRGDPHGELRWVGNITFGDPDPIGDKDFIARGGFLHMDRPLEMLSGILDLLRNEKPLFLQEDGTLTTGSEAAGEGE